jgi:hypothetical protein
MQDLTPSSGDIAKRSRTPPLSTPDSSDTSPRATCEGTRLRATSGVRPRSSSTGRATSCLLDRCRFESGLRGPETKRRPASAGLRVAQCNQLSGADHSSECIRALLAQETMLTPDGPAAARESASRQAPLNTNHASRSASLAERARATGTPTPSCRCSAPRRGGARLLPAPGSCGPRLRRGRRHPQHPRVQGRFRPREPRAR